MKRTVYCGLFIIISNYCLAATLRVPDEYGTIADAVTAAGDGDTVLLTDYEYFGAGNRNVVLAGKNLVIKSLLGAENCYIICQGQDAFRRRAFTIQNSPGYEIVIEGVNIVSGWGPFEPWDQYSDASLGGAVLVNNGRLTMKDCIIQDCLADKGSYGNLYTMSLGGAICAIDSIVTLENCTFTANGNLLPSTLNIFKGTDVGGAVFTLNSSLTITHCTFSINTALEGGAIATWDSNVKLFNSTFTDNEAGFMGGGISLDNSGKVLENCIICSNYVWGSQEFAMGGQGGGIFMYQSNPNIVNCTVSDNYIDYFTESGALDCLSSRPIIRNSIVWGNIGNEIVNGQPTVEYCNVRNQYTGTGNFDSEPNFVDTINRDYHIHWDSACTDKGDPESVVISQTDIDGEARMVAERIDVGADEIGPNKADLTRDGKVNYSDFNLFAYSWNSDQSDDNWYSLCDLIRDNIIDSSDFAEFINHWLWENETVVSQMQQP